MNKVGYDVECDDWTLLDLHLHLHTQDGGEMELPMNGSVHCTLVYENRRGWERRRRGKSLPAVIPDSEAKR